MGPAHRAGAAPFGIGLALFVPMDAGDLGPGLLPLLGELLAHLGLGLAVVGVAKWPDLDHPRFKGRAHIGAATVRLSARIGYAIHTKKDRPRLDYHRGPSHCLEWCALVGVLAWLFATRLPPLEPWAPWWGVAVFLGTASHVLLDAMTPSGVPLSAVWNAIVHREVWRRHAFTVRWSRLPLVAPWVVVVSDLDRFAHLAPVDGQAVDQDDQAGDHPARLSELLAHAVSPGVRATSSLVARVCRFAVPLPRLGVMAVDDRSSGCRPGLVTTDSGAERMLMIPFLYGTSATVLLYGVGLLGPLVSVMTS